MSIDNKNCGLADSTLDTFSVAKSFITNNSSANQLKSWNTGELSYGKNVWPNLQMLLRRSRKYHQGILDEKAVRRRYENKVFIFIIYHIYVYLTFLTVFIDDITSICDEAFKTKLPWWAKEYFESLQPLQSEILILSIMSHHGYV